MGFPVCVVVLINFSLITGNPNANFSSSGAEEETSYQVPFATILFYTAVRYTSNPKGASSAKNAAKYCDIDNGRTIGPNLFSKPSCIGLAFIMSYSSLIEGSE